MKKGHDIRIDRSLLHPRLDFLLDKLLKECAKKRIYLIITEGYRTKAYQDALYAKGRTKPGKIVTNAKGAGYNSQHQWGIAFDIAINDKKQPYDEKMLKKVVKIAKELGLGWGGDWESFVDTPHFFLKKWGSTTTKLKKLYGTPDKFKKTWYKKTIYSKNGGLPFWKSKKNIDKKKHGRIPKGKKVGILLGTVFKVRSREYQKVSYNGKYGYVNRAYLK